MKKKNNNKKDFSYINTINVGTPDHNIVVSINKTRSQVEEYLNKLVFIGPDKDKKKKEAIDSVLAEFEGEQTSGLYLYCNANLSFISLKSFNGRWFWLDVLNHEISHFVDKLSQEFYFDKETEFKAYLHECSFIKIRKDIFYKFDKHNKK